MTPEGECLCDVSPGPGELYPQLVHGVRVLGRGLWGPHPGRGVASPLQGKDVAPVTQNPLASRQPGQDVLDNTSLDSLSYCSLNLLCPS